jgi:hypothetical protein
MTDHWGFRRLERFLPHRRLVIVGVHLALVTVAYLLAFMLRFEFQVPTAE